MAEINTPNTSAQESELDRMIRSLPVDVQGEIVQMIRRDPSIARCLTGSAGREAEITQAVRAGRAIGAAPLPNTAPQGLFTKIKALWAKTKAFVRKLWNGGQPDTLYSNAFYAASQVSPDFIPLMQGAIGNAMAGVSATPHDHDDEHHDDHHDHHLEPAHPEQDGSYFRDKYSPKQSLAGGFTPAVLAEREAAAAHAEGQHY